MIVISQMCYINYVATVAKLHTATNTNTAVTTHYLKSPLVLLLSSRNTIKKQNQRTEFILCGCLSNLLR